MTSESIGTALDALGAVVLVVSYLFRGVLLLIGPGLLLLWWRTHAVERESRHWLAATGTVRTAELVERTFRSPKRARRKGYRARITYEYEAAGRTLSASTLSAFDVAFRGWQSFGVARPAAEALLLRYPAGTPVQLFLDPRDPTRALLRAGPSDEGRTLLVVGLVFLFGALFLVF